MDHRSSRFFVDIEVKNALPDLVVSRVDTGEQVYSSAAEFKRLSEQSLKDLIKKLWLSSAIMEDSIPCQR